MNKRQLIMEEALKLFAAGGYESTGVAAIVSAAEVTKPTLYHYFGNKEGLLRSIFEERFTPFINSLKKIDVNEKDIMRTIENYIDVYVRYSKNDEAFFWLVNHLRKAPLKSESHEIVNRYYKNEEEVISELMATISRIHSNLRGQEAFLVMNYLSLINGYIEVKILNKEMALIKSAEILQLTKQFLYGIYAL